MTSTIGFHSPHLSGRELDYVAEAHSEKRLAGDGRFTRLCHAWLEQRTGTAKALLTHSCTAALEMAMLLLDIAPGDEVIMPSFTFVSTANAVVLRGGVPVFLDIRQDTLNLDEGLIEAAITPRTRAIMPVHYAGVACEMDTIMEIGTRRGLFVVEDAAQGVGASYKGRALGSIGGLGAYSFHESKNIVSGEGGALLVNDPAMALRAEIIREKGTDRSRFFRGEVDKYTWQDIGSSYLPSELIAAFLWAQLEDADAINAMRLARWDAYHELLEPLEHAGKLRRPVVPAECVHNGHMYYVVLPDPSARARLLSAFSDLGIRALFHYVPLHSAPAGLRYGRAHGDLSLTVRLAASMLRLPLSPVLTAKEQERVVAALDDLL